MLYIFKKMCIIARNQDRGLAAVATLENEGLKPCFHQLDITDHESIITLRDFFTRKISRPRRTR